MLNTFLTGNKDVDRTILEKLSDRDILNACKTDKYTKEKVCDETFFRNLVYNRYPGTIKYKDYVKQRDWKNFYLSIIYYIDKLEKEYNFNYIEERKKEKNLSAELEYLSRKSIPKYIKYNENLNFVLKNATKNPNLPVVKYLVERGADIHYDNEYALRWAIGNGDLDIVKYLNEQGADIHISYDYPLRWASERGHLPVVKYLVENKANIHANHDEALRIAKLNNHLDIVNYLQSLQ